MFKNRQKITKKFGENEEFFALKTLITHLKPNLNDLKSEDHEGITLVTRLTLRLSLKLLLLLVDFSDFFFDVILAFKGSLPSIFAQFL